MSGFGFALEKDVQPTDAESIVVIRVIKSSKTILVAKILDILGSAGDNPHAMKGTLQTSHDKAPILVSLSKTNPNKSAMKRPNFDLQEYLGKTIVGVYHYDGVNFPLFEPLSGSGDSYGSTTLPGLEDGDFAIAYVGPNRNPDQRRSFNLNYLGLGSFSSIKPIQLLSAASLGFPSSEKAFLALYNQWKHNGTKCILFQSCVPLVKEAIQILRLDDDCFRGFRCSKSSVYCPVADLQMRIATDDFSRYLQTNGLRTPANTGKGVECFVPPTGILGDRQATDAWDSLAIIENERENGESPWISFDDFDEELGIIRNDIREFYELIHFDHPSDVRPYLLVRGLFHLLKTLQRTDSSVDEGAFLRSIQTSFTSDVSKNDIQQVAGRIASSALKHEGRQFSLLDSARVYGERNWDHHGIDKWCFAVLWNESKSKNHGEAHPPSGSIGEEDPEAERRAVLAFWKKLNGAGWKYSLRDIVRFHTSVRTGVLTILSGASGVGKSSLFKHYARFATACKEEGELWKRMNVVSTWMEPSDMLGWRSPLASGGFDFQAAPGGLQTFLEGLQTEERSGKLSLLCFEEMNLAQAELYFSDFLQAVSDPSEERKISNPRGGVFKISNLRIVGTCNIDHTTKPFTERFLDRCNYIDLSGPDRESAVNQFFLTFCPDDNPPVPQNGLPPFRRKTLSESGVKAIIDQKLQKDEDWSENWKQLSEALKELGVFPSRRVRVLMVEYILARPTLLDLHDPTLDDEKYHAEQEDSFLLGLDEALVQRVLPKLLLKGEWDKNDGFWKQVGLLKSLCEQNKLNLPLSKLFLEDHLSRGSTG